MRIMIRQLRKWLDILHILENYNFETFVYSKYLQELVQVVQEH